MELPYAQLRVKDSINSNIDVITSILLLILTGFATQQGEWASIQLFISSIQEADHRILVDIEDDGDFDAVIGYGHDNQGRLAWYEQPTAPEALWTEHLIATLGPAQAQSVDVADIDGDGDIDVVAGEHTNPDIGGLRMLAFENEDFDVWISYEVYVGDEHHDGAQLVDLDQDGDLDIISIGWLHRDLLIHENLQR